MNSFWEHIRAPTSSHRDETEKGILGCIINNQQEVSISEVNISLFANPINKQIFQAIQELHNEGKDYWVVSIRDVLVSKWLFGWSIDNNTILELSLNAIKPYEFESSIKVLRWLERKLEVERLVEKVQMDSEKSSSSLMKYAEELISIASVWGDKSHSISQEDVECLYKEIGEKVGKDLFGYSWWENFPFLDKNTRWIQSWVTYRVGAASNVGKTQFMYNVINSLMKQNAKVAFFTLENRKNTTLTYILSNYQRISSKEIESWEQPWEYDYLVSLKDKLFIIEDLYDIDSIFTKTLEIKPDVVILDYIWLTEIRKTPEEAKYTEYAKKVQQFVKRSWVAWIDLSNLPRDLQSAENIRISPQYYGSTFLRNNTDVGLHLYYNKELYERKEAVMSLAEPWSPATLAWKDKQFINMFISKNRLWTVWLEQTYKVDFSRGGMFLELSQRDKETLLS